MKKLILNIDKDVEKKLIDIFMMKRLCGNISGVVDEFTLKILQALSEKDTKEITLTMEEEKNKK